MGKKIDLAGQRFGRLTAISKGSKNASGKFLWLCICDCGNERLIPTGNLQSGNSRSCGCLRDELHEERVRTHGMTRSRIHNVWTHMWQRTTNPRDRSYLNYGGRGIKVCEQWRTFEGFYADMGPTYADGLTIDRIDNDGNYEPGNCRWITKAEQNRNRRSNVWIEFRGRRLCRAEWAEMLGIHPETLNWRLSSGWSVERALTEGVSPERLPAP